ncbi:MAG: hypothetical protein IJ304_02825 [Clostridia bacterium]|nr:hypothetical protein [Clostridia bacterium]
MKKILTILLALSMLASLAACGNKDNGETNVDNETIVETGTLEENVEPEEVVEQEEKPATGEKEDKKPVTTPSAKPEKTPEAKPEKTPEATPEAKPEKTPEATPEAAKTLGNTLLADFKQKASSMGTEELANALIANPAIKFMGGAMPVEEGLLSGFDGAEIKGFKSGAVFMPMIGSIPFIGYVFELENAADVSGFISNLKNNANLRWNICVTADEMVTGSVGNKVFFVMCPTSLEE